MNKQVSENQFNKDGGRRGLGEPDPAGFVAAATRTAHDAVDQIGNSAQNVSEQISSGVEQVTKTSKDVVNAATHSATTMTSSLESFGRSNPLVAMGAAVLVGIVLGMWRGGRA